MNANNIIKRIMKSGKAIALCSSFLIPAAMTLTTTSCQDLLEVESNDNIDADKDHLSKANDSIYSVIGVLNKLQAIGDRTILLGEARGDLVDVTSATPKDLRNLALFNIDDDNKYNSPTEYYAVINNCNYFIAHADTALVNNRNERIFLNEYAAVKAARAWTYLQLVCTYGKVPFVTEPIMTKEDSEKDYPMYGIEEVCNYFLNQDGLQALADNENINYPSYGDIKGTPSRLFYFPMNIVLGDLYLWKATFSNSPMDYLDAAKRYYQYISKRNGTTTSSYYATGTNNVSWMNNKWLGVTNSWASALTNESNAEQSEVISVIPMDSIRSEGNYSEVRGLYCSTFADDNLVSLVPSQSLIDLSESQDYCYYDSETDKFSTVPKGLSDHRDGDLRLSSCWYQDESREDGNGNRYTFQSISKFQTKNGNLHIYRRAQVYLRLAEAMNRAGYPRFAFQVLQSGITDDVVSNCVLPFCLADSTVLSEFKFPTSRYVASYYNPVIGNYIHYGRDNNRLNTIGIHSRGCGESPFNEFYQMPYNDNTVTIDTTFSDDGTEIYTVSVSQDTEAQKEDQMTAIEDLIVNECALETAFEGYRFYDLMRVALRRHDPSYLANKVYARKGAKGGSDIAVDLNNTSNWYLKWNGQIGIQ